MFREAHIFDRKFKAAKKDFVKIELLVRDPDNEMIKLLQKISKHANPGHSFAVVVDPDASKADGGGEKFFFDGDGSFYVKEIKVDGEKPK